MTNGILPARFRIHMRSSTARAMTIRRYISRSSSRDSPRFAPNAVSDLLSVLVAIEPPLRLERCALEVDRLAVDGERCLAHGFGESRVRVNRRAHLPRCGLEKHAHARLGD